MKKRHSGPNKPHRKNQPQPKPAQRLKANLWGTHAVREAWLNPRRQIHAFYATEQAMAGFEKTFHQGRKKAKRPEASIVAKDVLDKAFSPGTVHQGLALLAGPLPEIFVQDLISATDGKDRALILMLDQVTDPHNVGAILRSACAFGADGVIMQRKHAPDLDGVLAKTACGAADHIPVAYETNLTRTLETLQDAGFFVIGLDERGEKTIAETDVPAKSVLVLGAEGPGLRRLVSEQCDLLVHLPTQGPIASLNVSNAAAVALYAMKTP